MDLKWTSSTATLFIGLYVVSHRYLTQHISTITAPCSCFNAGLILV